MKYRNDFFDIGRVRYPIPGRDGVLGYLLLPEDLTQDEAKRICEMVSALTITNSKQQ